MSLALVLKAGYVLAMRWVGGYVVPRRSGGVKYEGQEGETLLKQLGPVG